MRLATSEINRTHSSHSSAIRSETAHGRSMRALLLYAHLDCGGDDDPDDNDDIRDGDDFDVVW